MRILITGATGFIGSHLVKRLRDHEVYAIVRHSPRQRPAFIDATTLTADLIDIHGLKKAIQTAKPEIVLHLGALTPVRHSFQNPFVYAETNYVGTMNMVHAALESPVLRKFVFASTAETYKAKVGPMKETDESYGSTPYGVSKVAAELYVRVAGDCYGLPYIVLRPSNTYGREKERGYVTEKIITAMLTEDKLFLNGTSDSVRDFMYVSDHVNGYLKAMETDAVNEVFNISTGVSTTIGELVELARLTLNWEGEVVFGGKPRPYDPPSLVLDNFKAERLLKWRPEVDLETGLQVVADYWRMRI